MITQASIWGALSDAATNKVFAFPVNAGAPTSGSSGTGANLCGPGSLLIDTTNKNLYINTNTLASPTWTKIASLSTGGAPVGVSGLNVAHAIYSFAVDGGATGSITPVSTASIPANAIIVGGTINSTTAVTSGGAATVAVGTTAGSSTTSILGATGKASFTTDALINSAATLAAPVKMSTAGNINITVATAALTAGIIEIFVLFYVATNA